MLIRNRQARCMFVAALALLSGCASSQARVCSGGLTRARPIFTGVPWAYTDEARRNGIEGRVVTTVTIDAQGNPTDVRIIHGLGFGLDESVVTGVRGMKFEPATRCGKPVASELTVAARFAKAR